jgi:hypothetical protein
VTSARRPLSLRSILPPVWRVFIGQSSSDTIT